ncbi:MAG: hypothetical protein WCQ20_01960 [Synechococcaceae cyanobacterium ELA739]
MDADDRSYRRDDRFDGRGGDPRRAARDGQPLEQRLDRWVSAGRQLVDGVAGSRPGSRPPARAGEGRAGGLGPGRSGGFDGLGRWVEQRLDWLLDDGEDWREPWQESGPRSPSPSIHPNPTLDPWAPRGAANPAAGFPALERVPAGGATAVNGGSQGRSADARDPSARPTPAGSLQPPAAAPRRRLEALSRRGLAGVQASQPAAPAAAPDDDAWPDDESFSLPRWQRSAAGSRPPEPAAPAADPAEATGRPLPRSTRRSGPRV